MKRMKIACLLCLMAVIGLRAAPAWAQSTATVEGTVVDSQNAAIPGATVVVSNSATGLSRTIVTDASGSYVAASLPPGTYQIEVTLAGFGTHARDVRLQVSRSTRMDITMNIAAVAEQ